MMKLKDSDIGDEGAKMIGEVLKNNSTLTTLELYGDEKQEGNAVKKDVDDNDRSKINREQYWR